ncbi:MAG TPA: hypothetical protein PLN51_08670 [Ornithinibacter sp.]|nr:hypothetical protein [Ornithinibacter sp.]HQZ10253.1 hypothetical protein [Ornithinibacter sp.]
MCAVVFLAPFGFWVVATDPPGWRGSLVAALGCVAYVFIVVPWVMRGADLRRRRRN